MKWLEADRSLAILASALLFLAFLIEESQLFDKTDGTVGWLDLFIQLEHTSQLITNMPLWVAFDKVRRQLCTELSP